MKRIIIIISVFLIGGCYDYTEIDDTSIITGIILDYNDNKYELISEVLENEKESKTKVYRTTCNNIESCILQISESSNKQLFISHQKVLILTDRTVNKNIDFYDYFLRNSKSKMNFYIYYVSDEYKDKIFDNKTNISFYLKDLIDFNTKDYSSLVKLTFIDMIQKLSEDGIDNIYPNISIKDNNIIVDSLISFNKKNKIILDSNNSIFFNILSNNINNTLLSIPCEEGSFSLNINKIKSKYKLDNDLNIKIKASTKLSNYNCKYDLNDNKTINVLESIANNYIKEKSEDLIKLTQKENIDFLGLSNYVYKHSKKEVDLNNINLKINSNIKITSIGESR